MNATETVLSARKLLESLTPLNMDCGKLCGAACCGEDESGGNGMLLLPGEEELYEAEPFPLELEPDDTLFEGGSRLVCQGKCTREDRPFNCRIFPLRMALDEEGNPLRLEIDPRAWAVCPLCDRGGVRGMSVEFRKGARAAYELLTQNPEIREALRREQKMLEETRKL